MGGGEWTKRDDLGDSGRERVRTCNRIFGTHVVEFAAGGASQQTGLICAGHQALTWRRRGGVDSENRWLVRVADVMSVLWVVSSV